MSDPQGMREFAYKVSGTQSESESESENKSNSQSNEKVYRLPGDKTWEYLVKDGQWMTRKVGSQRLTPIISLSQPNRSEAYDKLDAAFMGARGTARLSSPPIEAYAKEAPDGPTQFSMEEDVFFMLEDQDDPYEYMVKDGEWVTRKKGSDKILSLGTLPLDKQLEAIAKLDENFAEARSDKEKATSLERIGDLVMALPEGDPIAERVAKMKMR